MYNFGDDFTSIHFNIAVQLLLFGKSCVPDQLNIHFF